MPEHDLVIRGGTVVDGTGSPPRTADVTIDAGTITEVGAVDGTGRREVPADGALVTPGFVDIHTHYDGQVTWDTQLLPSAWHGVTTVVMGNCGVGFAPVHDDDHDRLIELMEGVEDIPGAALHEGITWEWESFAEYLDAVGRGRRDVDVAAQVPHGAVRLYVMRDRAGADNEATPEDIDRMARVVRDGVAAGALGFTTSRTRNHRASTGEFTPSLRASRDELVGIAIAMGETGAGVLQVVSDFFDFEYEFGLLRAMAEASGRPLSVSLAQPTQMPDTFRQVLDGIRHAVADGMSLRAQVAARAIGLVLGLPATFNPFSFHPAYQEIAALPFEERVRAFREPARRPRLLDPAELGGRSYFGDFRRVFDLGDPPNYEPDPDRDSLAAQAAARGIPPQELAYELMLERGGGALLYMPLLNYADGDLEAVRTMMADPNTVPGLSDGGAHVGSICDASFPTTLLTHWGRDRRRGDRFPVEWLVKGQTRDTAATVGLLDRGVLAPGYRGDVNVIDFEGLRLRPPEIVFDLPAGGRRLLQRAEGYLHTFVAGEETYAGGEHTGAFPGRLVRGHQPPPGARGLER